jgi:hypothetical protein
MFERLRFRGAGGSSIVWGYRTAIRLASWAVVKAPVQGGVRWRLQGISAVIEDPIGAKRFPPDLVFAVPRPGGFLLWPIISPVSLAGHHVSAFLGPPRA